MTTSVLIALVVIVGWSLVAGRLARFRISGPLLMVTAGIAIGLSTRNDIGQTLNTVAAEKVVELILAVLLFVDATEVKGGYFAGERRTSVRLLLVAMPLSIGAALLAGAALLPSLSIGVLLVIACIAIPIDLAPTSSMVRDKRIPVRVRNVLNIESGYNDGIVAPLFVFALTLAGDHSHAEGRVDALETAVPSAVYAIVAGGVVGVVAAWLTNQSMARGFATEQSIRISLVIFPLLAYGSATELQGNGFVAAFICGIAYKAARSTLPTESELSLVDDVSVLAALAMWFVFGCTAVLVLEFGFVWQIIVLAVAALTVLRIVPVYLSLLGTTLSRTDRLVIGMLGPRGTASIVFGLLAYNALEGRIANDTLYAMTVTVLGSVVIHGIGSTLVAQWYERRSTPSSAQ
ncbi:cation:proton antiporter [Williamsia sp. 1135]|uniref:cation:proton antiporter n=1 Tax=Williamsia sp. 1135 TaxID=1889262 RepID=UPI000A1038B6|nr:cation:proton antiporter [Williamsia sp. 1135]ORM36427.1 sodium:proton exchanger [Williamsia sp. 1135]